ncbi:MAG: hypothetical protein M0O92_00175 [Acholeplasmataceae bacterium]|nr:hypothetical protein [Acholeplasmataceae bacterium]
MISVYLDNGILNYYQELKLPSLPLRKINGKKILKIPEKELTEIVAQFKKDKIKVGWLDLPFDYLLTADFETDKLSDIAKLFNVNHLFINLPKLIDFNAEKKLLIEVLKSLIRKFKQNKIKLSFHIDYQIDSAILAFIITEIKDLNLVFDAAKCAIFEKSISAYYRLLKNNIDIVVFYDVNEDNEPTLLGYGKAQTMEMAERLKLNKFKGDVLFDCNLSNYHGKRLNLYKKRLPFFKGKQHKSHLFIEEKLALTKESDLTYGELVSLQLNLLEKILK